MRWEQWLLWDPGRTVSMLSSGSRTETAKSDTKRPIKSWIRKVCFTSSCNAITHLEFHNVIKVGGKGYSDKNTPNCTQTEISLSKFIYDQVQWREGKGEEEQIWNEQT